MRWLFRKPDRRWRVDVQHLEGFSIIEATDPPALRWKGHRDLFLDVLERVFRRYEVLSLSQMIGVGQGWDHLEALGSLQEIESSIRQRFSPKTAITTTYGDASWPDASDLYFVVHVMGQLDRCALEELVGFGMDSLPNIAYGLAGEPEHWPQQVLEWNEVFVRWFRLKVGNTALGDSILDRVEMLFWTCDGHLVFATKDLGEHEEIAKLIADVSEQHELDLIVGETTRY